MHTYICATLTAIKLAVRSQQVLPDHAEVGIGPVDHRLELAHDRPLLGTIEGEEPAESIRRAINDALHVTTTQAQQMETDILELARAGRTIDAIKLARTRYGYDLTQAKQFVDGLSR